MKNTEIKTFFQNGIIEQERLVENLATSLIAYQKNKESYHAGIARLASILLSGMAGLGKTHVLDVMQACYEKAGFMVLRFNNPRLELRSKTDLEGLYESLRAYENLPLLIIIDESHELFNSDSTVPQKAFASSLLRALDAKKPLQESVQVNEDQSYPFNPSMQFFVFATNFAHLHGKRDKGETFNSRLQRHDLTPYTRKGMMKILLFMLEKAGIRADERSLEIIIECGRGSARPMQHIVSKLSSIALASGKKTVNKEDILFSLQALNLFPLGLYPVEVSILELMTTQERSARSLVSIFYKEDAALIRKYIASLANITPPKAKEPLATETKSNKFIATDTGMTYIHALKSKGFSLPAIQ